MATKLKSYSTTPGSNNSAAPNGWPEGMLPSAVNDSAREMMARLAEWYQDAEWILRNDTVTGFTGTTLTITGDVTAAYAVGRVIRLDESNSKRALITASSYGAPSTTVTVVGYTIVGSPTAIELGILNTTETTLRPRIDVASAATVDLDSAAYRYVRITGTTTITAITLSEGRARDVVAGGAFSITAGASLIFPGIASGSTITLAAGDTFRAIGEASGVVRVQNLSRARNALEITADVSTGSGTSIAVASSIPPGVRRITINFNGVTADVGNDILVQIGDSGGLETTSYASSSGVMVDAAATVVVSSTSGFIINNAGPGAFQGHMVLTLMNEASNRWIASHAMRSTATRAVSGGGIKALSATLDRITLVLTGAGAFSAGQVNIMYE